MSILFAYEKEDRSKRIHISDYEKDSHKGKICCIDGHEIVAKKGQKVTWHYSHKKADDSGDSCSRAMGSWHHWWQDRVEKDFLEIIMKRDGKKHIADMINADDIVIEFQKSIVSPEIIQEREAFYNNMIWIFCCNDMLHKVVSTYGRYMRIKMLGGSKFFLTAKKPTFLDFDKRGVLELIKVKNPQKSKPELYVKIWTMDEFDKIYMHDCLNKSATSRIDREPYFFQNKDENFADSEKFLNKKK